MHRKYRFNTEWLPLHSLIPIEPYSGLNLNHMVMKGNIMSMEVADIQTAETPTPFKPALGRIVHVYFKEDTYNGTNIVPAMITRVWSDTCVNLTLFPDNTLPSVKNSVTNNPNDSVYWQSPPRV